ncbi:phosphoribosylaminoimidazolesuccinocarboxamide synthase [Halobaculum sp. MBLA0147]|uniref:phosphoribosylaminoimidazolesuccinocarboxamide synthase n=1 Tax=Halobaculum sp. MBLA0147 TaxID=3079934 RepID=UPI0035267386
MTSVKEFRVAEQASRTATGRGRFVFTDDYSVFDWGQMPDQIPGKGASLCLSGAATFESLAAAGVPTHYRGVAIDGGPARELTALDEPPREMVIDLVQVPDLPYVGADGASDAAGEGSPDTTSSGDTPTHTPTPGVENGYDYDAFYAAAGETYLVPLEIVFRNAVPVGSSLRRRREPAEVGLDRAEWPDEPVTLPEPVVEFSTKYEERDRYLDRETADRLAGRASVDRLAELARRVNEVVTERAAAAGLTHEDGKIECYYAGGEVGVADVTGTLDENRFAHEGRQVSKEAVRQYYRREHPEWVDAVSDAKRRADAEGVADWRPLCELSPPALPETVVETVADAYVAAADAYVAGDHDGAGWFDAPSLPAAVAALDAI